MEITEVRIRAIESPGKVQAMASITIDDAFAVHDLRIVDGSQGLFVSMPSRRTASGEYFDLAHPVTAETREQVQEAVLEAYHESDEEPPEAPADDAAGG